MTKTSALSMIGKLFEALDGRDEQEIFSLFSDDAVLFDPHYPQMEMRGREAIERGLAWGLSSIEQFGFTIVESFESDDGTKAMVEVDTHHVLSGGKKLDFPQVFAIEASGDRVIALRAYEPYRPNGIPGFFIRMSHMSERIKHRVGSKG